MIVTFWWGQALLVCDPMQRELAVLAWALETAGLLKFCLCHVAAS